MADDFIPILTTQPGDQTYFRHIDIDIPDAIHKKRGVNMILQGSLTLTQEKARDCTQILLGMHNHIEEWWECVAQRGLGTDGFVHRIKDRMFTREDAYRYRTDTEWTDVGCDEFDRQDIHITAVNINPEPQRRRGSLQVCLED